MDSSGNADRRDNPDLALFDALKNVSCDVERALLEEQIISHYRPLARRLASRYVHRGAELDDLSAVADFALLKAIRRFDCDRGVFTPFATVTILGEIKKYFRDACWTIRPTRRIQELQARVVSAAEALRADGGPDRPVDLAESLDVPTEDVREALSARSNFWAASLDAPLDRTDRTLAATLPSVEDGYERIEDRVSAMSVCAELPPEDRELLRLRFFEDFTQQEIADHIGTNQVQVSRRLNRILARLHAGVTAATG